MVVFRGETTDTKENVSIKFTGISDKLVEFMDVENNLECIVKRRNRSEDKFQATGQLFYSIEIAEQYVRILKSLRSPYTAKAFFCVNTEEYGPMAIVERLTGIGAWVLNNNKSMWRLNKDGQSSGFGSGFLHTLSQIMEGLKSLHRAGHSHGNLWGGVHFGADNHIRLNNFDVGCMIKRETNPLDVLSDFTGVEALCSFWIASDPPSREVPEADYFSRLFRFTQYQSFEGDYSMTDIEIIGKFIYKLPKMFHPTTIAILFNIMPTLQNIMSEKNVPCNSFIDLTKHFPDNWSNKVSSEELLHVLHYPNCPKLNPNNAKLDVNYCIYKNVSVHAYKRVAGIKLFARNALQHAASTFAEAVKLVLNDYPAMHLKFFLELIQTEDLKTMVEVNHKNVQFHEYLSDILQLDDVLSYL